MTTLARFHSTGLDKRKLQTLIASSELTGILLSSPENVFYTTGYTALPSSGNPILYTLRSRLPFFVYIDRNGTTTLICWDFATQGVDFGADNVVGFNDLQSAMRALEEVLGENLTEGDAVGVESTCPYAVVVLLQRNIRSRITVADEILRTLRLIKSSDEIASIRRSTEIIEATVSELYDILHPGMSRLELIQEAKIRMLRHGATGISHTTFSFAGENPEVAIDERLNRESLVTLDLGAFYNGYASDNRRYAYVGRPSQSVVETYNAMVAIVDGVGAALRPGAVYADVYQSALDLYSTQGVQPLARFNHVGHNIGLETEEEWLDNRRDAKVEAGMVINIELYATTDTGAQIGDEETYIIDEAGPQRISSLPREIRDISGALR